MLNALFFPYSFTEFLHSLRMQSHVCVYGSDRVYANQHDKRTFRFSECSDGKQTPTPPSHFGFIYDAMNSECAKMDFRFAESTVNSWTLCSLSLSQTRRVANRKHGVSMFYFHCNPDGTPPPATAYLYVFVAIAMTVIYLSSHKIHFNDNIIFLNYLGTYERSRCGLCRASRAHASIRIEHSFLLVRK